eukprot:CAMPEP_0113539028 /NCGR_PEP_ID=MMETSP0015_2-20120614/7697_1 /TAXON_ID=2838 /ORGANISM="Odontella" /LENGTH=381 /DNA_ID=CAMNT_0000438675 /DNA_START=354 /DNA_END=1499 /DNA_ORIENTATION=- /assembly_acc=CAM_ASM_000160
MTAMEGETTAAGDDGNAHNRVSERMVPRIELLPKELRNLIAGGVAGMVAKTFVAPIDRIKILYQISTAHFRLRDVPGVAFKIIRTEGVTALWKGNLVTMIRVFPYSGIQFMIFDRIKMHFIRKHDHERSQWLVETRPHEDEGERPKRWGLSPSESLISGSLAGAVSVCCTYPLDLTRAQLAVLRKKRSACGKNIHQSFPTVFANNYKKGGMVGLYRGITPTLLGILPYSGIAFTINEQAKRKIHHVTGREPSTVERMQCGALSGLVAQSMTYPLEVTRRRMQTIGIIPTSGGESAVNVLGGTLETTGAQKTAEYVATHKPASMMCTIRQVIHEQGFRGLVKGVSMNWMKGPIAFSISFTTFDIVQGLMATESEKLERAPRH